MNEVEIFSFLKDDVKWNQTSNSGNFKDLKKTNSWTD